MFVVIFNIALFTISFIMFVNVLIREKEIRFEKKSKVYFEWRRIYRSLINNKKYMNTNILNDIDNAMEEWLNK